MIHGNTEQGIVIEKKKDVTARRNRCGIKKYENTFNNITVHISSRVIPRASILTIYFH